MTVRESLRRLLSSGNTMLDIEAHIIGVIALEEKEEGVDVHSAVSGCKDCKSILMNLFNQVELGEKRKNAKDKQEKSILN